MNNKCEEKNVFMVACFPKPVYDILERVSFDLLSYPQRKSFELKEKALRRVLKLCRESSSRNYALGDGSSDCSATNDFSPSLKKESNGKFTYVLKG